MAGKDPYLEGITARPPSKMEQEPCCKLCGVPASMTSSHPRNTEFCTSCGDDSLLIDPPVQLLQLITTPVRL